MINEIKHSQPLPDNLAIRTHLVTTFLAGSISNSKRNWQKEVIDILKELDKQSVYKDKYELFVFNPREFFLDKSDDKTISGIVRWDYSKLSRADIASFYFGDESSQTFSMLELGVIIGKALKEHPYYYDIEKHVVISVSKNYIYREKLLEYLEAILEQPLYDIIVDEEATIESHAKAIYNLFNYYMEKRESIENTYFTKT